jgi:hypothetical protein
MEPHLETLRLIRQITEDGLVTDDEVMSLGTFLNDDPDARRAWPGNVLFEMLRHVFDDGKLESHELKALAYMLRGIELQCCGTLGGQLKPARDDVPAGAEFAEIDFKLPILDETRQVTASTGTGKISSVNLFKHECSCGDWSSKRFAFPENSPGRACRCMVLAYSDTETLNQIPRLEWNGKLFQLIDIFSECGSTFDAVPSWKLLQYGSREWLISWGDREWANVYTENSDNRVERYSYHLFDGRWAYGATPIGAAAIKHYFTGDVGGNTTIPGF